MIATLMLLVAPPLVPVQGPFSEGPALGFDRVTQTDIVGGGMTLDEIRAAGLVMFATPFNKEDGFGDGPMNAFDPTSPGGRPTLQDNGLALRVNGLDAQSCIECHFVGSNATVPFTFAVGGVGGVSANVMAGPTEIDVDASFNGSFAFFNGRFINPPFVFGSGGVELAAKEMTNDLNGLKARAKQQPGTPIALITKGVQFGRITWIDGVGFDTSEVRGIDDDLVVRPFGRKGEFATVRDFARGAMPFHFGMQPVEVVGADVDDDGDGVDNEVLVGEMSALHIFCTNVERPIEKPDPFTVLGKNLFSRIGCAACHKPFLDTSSKVLPYSHPEVAEDPFANIYYGVDLAASTAGFDVNPSGGIRVPLYSDLRRHKMGPDLAESTGTELDDQFITARLWGVADTAPYLHDGRAATLTEAILMHGGAAQRSRDAFVSISDADKELLLDFLRSLRAPDKPADDL